MTQLKKLKEETKKISQAKMNERYNELVKDNQARQWDACDSSMCELCPETVWAYCNGPKDCMMEDMTVRGDDMLRDTLEGRR